MLTMNAIYCFECEANVFDVFLMYALYFNKKRKRKNIYIYFNLWPVFINKFFVSYNYLKLQKKNNDLLYKNKSIEKIFI